MPRGAARALRHARRMERPFGPNSTLVERYLAQLARLTAADFAAIVVRWRDGLRKSDAWYAAEDAVGDGIARTRRDDEMWLVQDRLYALFRGTPWYQQRVTPPEVATQYLANSAAMALMVADAIPRDALAILYAPFAEAIPLADLVLEPIRDGGDELRNAG